MSNRILVPSLGESVTEATVAKWLKQVGEEVDSDEPLVELETDKVNIEVPSPLAGTLSSIKVKEGDTVEVGSLLGLVSGEGKSPVEEKEKIRPAKKIDNNIVHEKTNNYFFHPGKSAQLKLGKNIIAQFGEIHPFVLQKYAIKTNVNGFEIFLDQISQFQIKKISTRNAYDNNDSNYLYLEKN